MPEKSKALRTNLTAAAVIVMLGMMASRILGYGKTMIVAFFFGRGGGTDAFYTALAIPELLYLLVSGGALTAAIIPVISDILVRGREDGVSVVVNSIGHIMVLILGAGVLFEILFTPLVVKLLFPGFQAGQFDLTVKLTRLIAPIVFFTGLSALCTGALHAHNKFTSPALAWTFYNLGIILGAVLLRRAGIFGVGYGALLGGAMLFAVQIPDLIKVGYRYRPSVNLKDPDVKKVLKLFVPAMVGLAIMEVNLMFLPLYLGSYLGEGTNTALRMAHQLMILPLGIFAIAISSAVFPALSRHAGAGEMKDYKTTFVKGLNGTFLLSLPSTAVLIVLAAPITRLLFQHGEFAAADTRATAWALTFFAVGLAGHSALYVIVRSFYALMDTLTPVWVGIGAIALITIPAGRILSRTTLGTGGVALAVSINALLSAIILIILLRRKIGAFNISSIITGFLKTGFSTAIMAAVMWLVAYKVPVFGPDKRLVLQAAQVFGAMTAGAAVYAASTLALNVPEARSLVRKILGKVGLAR